MRLLVTGGAGFIGSNFVRLTRAERPEVRITVLDALTEAADPTALDGLDVELVRGDVADAAVVDPLVAAADVVVHFAAESHNDAALAGPWPFVHSNIVGTFTLLQSCIAHSTRLHHVSTDEVFGDLALDDPGRFTEQTPYDPSSPYSATKAASDLLVRAWIRSYGLRATLSNCSNNYGPYQHVEKFIPRQITEILSGRPPRLYGSGAHVRDWIHVDDHNAAVWAILDRGQPGRTYLIGADGEASNLQVVRTICELMGVDPERIVRVTDRPGHDLRYAIDASATRAELGWRPRHTDLAAGLARTVEWYTGHPEWWTPRKAAVEERYARSERELDAGAGR